MDTLKRIKAFFTAAVFTAALISCAVPAPEFVLSAVPDTYVLGTGELILNVETENAGGSYKYYGSSTKVGAVPEFYCILNGQKYILACAPVIESADYAEVTVAHGETIKREWRFNNNGQFGAVCPGGVYSLKLTYFTFEKIFPAFIIVTDEGADVSGGAQPDGGQGGYDDGEADGSFIIL